jgi:molybdopterin-binding protein
VTRQAAEGLGLAEGTLVYASFKATGVMPYR